MSKMHLTKCEECGYEITMKTKNCLNCGERIGGLKKPGLKSFRGIVRAIFFILFAAYMLFTALQGFFK